MRKRILLSFYLLIISLILSGCSALFTIIDIGKNIIDRYQEEDYVYPQYDLDKLKTVSNMYTGAMPSIGEVNVLVILIEFPDEKASTDYSISTMEKIFFDLNYNNSVASYYYESSYKKLKITGDVIGWYQTKNYSKSYERKYDINASDMILKEALEYYYNSGYDFSKYDSDNDGYIDAVYGIYSRDYDMNSDVWWAYQTSFSDYSSKDRYLDLDGNYFSNYVWASLGFLQSGILGSIDTSTYIHETGHLMGLDDYYDYDETVGIDGGLGGADMMDHNVGDHCSISKILLGWVEPRIIDLSIEDSNLSQLTLQSFTMTGDVIMITKDDNKSLFNEYFLIELYSPTNLNSTNTFFTKSGIRILHVDASLGDQGMEGEYFTYFNYDNSDSNRKFVNMITPRGPYQGGINDTASNSDLFKQGSSLQKNFITFYDSEVSFGLNVESISLFGKTSTITIIR